MKRSSLLILILPILLMSCEGPFISPLADYTFDAYDGALKSELIQSSSSFSPREDFATVVYDDCIWVMGGYDRSARGSDDSYREDVYKSSDGEHWDLVTADAPWKGRRALAATVFEDHIYISGGFSVDGETGERAYANDLWRTQDGIAWEEVTSEGPWTARMNHAMLSTDTALYIFGGFCQDGSGPRYFDDMWKLGTGETEWTELTDVDEGTSVPYGARAAFAYGKAGDYFYLQGGAFAGMTQASAGVVDESVDAWAALWRFDPEKEGNDTIGWESTWKVPLESSHTRSEHALVCYDDKLMLFSGKANSSLYFSKTNRNYATLYYSLDSTEESDSPWEQGFADYSWKLDSYGGVVEPRYGYELEVFDDSIVLIGGYSCDGPQNDVWKITESEDE